jgi:hypothetical protein
MFTRRMQQVGMVRSDLSAQVIGHLLSSFAFRALTIDKAFLWGLFEPCLNVMGARFISI